MIQFLSCSQCMLWSWYLADDTQFFIVGAFILIIAVRYVESTSSEYIDICISLTQNNNSNNKQSIN